jgi:hypothetical protein
LSVAKCEWLGEFMSRFSLFVLPVVAGVGTYVLVLLLLPELDQLVALFVALLTGWTVRWALGRLQL